MQCSHFLLTLTILCSFYGGLASWLTYGKVWSRDFGGEAAPNYKCQPVITLTVRADLNPFYGNGFCEHVYAEVNGNYRSDCIPQIPIFSDPSELITVCHRLYGSCRCRTIKPVTTQLLDIEISAQDPSDSACADPSERYD